MGFLDRYISEMRDRPFTMVMLCFVTIMTTSNAAKTPDEDLVFTQQRMLREISLTQVAYGSELQLSYQQCIIETAETGIQQLKFLKSLHKNDGYQIQQRIEELQSTVDRATRKIGDIQETRQRELEKVNRFYNDHQPQRGGTLWEGLM